ncbi:MAG: SCP2 sterol-binding domain-containing protein [Actinomycetota bacterium]|nr:SCP2 sterol-binding domain-containing protein [Actinomycetota bacterium]
MLIDQADPAVMDPLAFARVVKATPTDVLRRVMSGERRTPILAELVRRMPDVFRPDRAAGHTAVVHWRVGGRPDGGLDVYELVIADGACTVSPTADGQPQLVLTLDAVDFLRMLTGNANAVALVMRGRLRSKGDLVLTAKLPGFFEPPRP